MLELEGVSTYYGQIRALDSIDLRIQPQEIVTLVGANGAGKTTLLNTISGILSPRRGHITFDGQVISHRSPESIVRLGISHVPERRQIFWTLSVIDNLRLGAYHRRGKGVGEDIARVFELFPILKGRQRQAGGTLSGGEQQMLAIGRGLMARPRLLLLDEPSVGLAPLLVRDIMRIVSDLRELGTTILLAEQNASAALQVADRGYVLETGRIVLTGTTSELMERTAVQQAYLGKKQRARVGA